MAGIRPDQDQQAKIEAELANRPLVSTYDQSNNFPYASTSELNGLQVRTWEPDLESPLHDNNIPDAAMVKHD